MEEQIKEQALSALTKAQDITILAFEKSGFDALASGLALFLSLEKLGKNIQIVTKLPTVGDALSLYGVDRIGSQIKQNLQIIINNAVDNVDKVTYNLEGEKLKIVVHNLPNSKGVSQNEVSIEKNRGKTDILILLGTNSEELVINESIHEQINNPEIFKINISKENLTNNIAQLNLVSPDAPALSELSTFFIQELALPIDEDIAYNLYAGIANSTAMFSPAVAKPSTFEAALWLIKFGAGKASFAKKVDTQRITQVGQTKAEDFSQKVDNIQPAIGFEINQTPIEDVEREKQPKDSSWLKPPKIYHGSKSFDSES